MCSASCCYASPLNSIDIYNHKAYALPNMAKKKKNRTLNRNRKIIILLATLLMVYVGFRLFQASKDVQTRKHANTIGTQLGEYITEKRTVPLTLEGAGITNVPKTVRYSYVSTTKFKLCADFQKFNNPSAGAFQKFINLLVNQPDNLAIETASTDGTIYGVAGFDDLHLAGPDCQTVEYYTIAPAHSLTDQSFYKELTDNVCDVRYQVAMYNRTLVKVGTLGNNKPYISLKGSDANQETVGDIKMKVFDQSCHEIKSNDLESGDPVDVYYISDPNVLSSQIIIALQKHVDSD